MLLRFTLMILLTTFSFAELAHSCAKQSEQDPPDLNHRSIVLRYYDDVDVGAIDSIMPIFAENARYERGTVFQLNSRSEIDEFYRGVRTLVGSHTLQSVRVVGNEVFVTGRFSGRSGSEPIDTMFADHWVFDSEGLVSFRKSWIELDGI